MNEHRPNFNALMPPVIKNLLIINGIMLLATVVLESSGIDLTEILGLFYFRSEHFRIWQIVTHIFMHGGFLHLLSNMFALWMLGATLENFFGSRKFLEYYLLTGIGAAVLHMLVLFIEAQAVLPKVDPDNLRLILENGSEIINRGQRFNNEYAQKLNLIYNVPTVGASGAVFGVLFAFGWLFPNTRLFIIPIPFPIKAKYFVIGYALFELYSGLASNPGDNIAHFAHIGGMIIGFLLMKIWRVRRPYDYF
ncbi:MAG: rhomboid family intramembrane serine protease [Mucilaginibacter polytrichastri]|nr:rhomboid family intramembrane serine protease [Mucilaginibacter polytrichastri]